MQPTAFVYIVETSTYKLFFDLIATYIPIRSFLSALISKKIWDNCPGMKGDIMQRNLSDSEVNRVLEEEFIREAELIEKSLFPEGIENAEPHITEKDIDDSWQRFVTKLTAKGFDTTDL